MKPNLILISGFSTNSYELDGLIKFLNKFAKVHFIDLPGFIRSVPPLKSVTLEHFIKYVEKKINEFDLRSYWLGGLSFGFLLADRVKDSKKCRGIFALEPYLNACEIRTSWFNKLRDLFVIKTLATFNLYDWYWHTKSFKKLLTKNDMNARVGRMLKETNPRTFFKTGRIILTNEKKVKFKPKPHVLILNQNDELVNADGVEQNFREHVKKLLVIRTSAPHIPKQRPTVKYFERRIGKDYINEFSTFMKNA